MTTLGMPRLDQHPRDAQTGGHLRTPRDAQAGGGQDPKEEPSCCPMDGHSWHRGTPGLSQSEGRLRMWLCCRDGEIAQRKEGEAPAP